MAKEPMKLGYDPVYTDGIDPSARFPRMRYRLTAEAVTARAHEAPVALVSPTPVTRDHLLLAHDPSYVDAFLAYALDARAQRRIGLRPWTPAIVDRTLLLTGGTVDALHAAVRSGGYAANMAGGTHHAFAEMGGGYCVFNDLAIVARLARRTLGLERVLVVDLDVHQGDGTAAIFADEPEVFTFSMHCAGNYPFRKQRSDLDVALPVGTGDEGFLTALDEHLPRALAHRPDLVLFQAGVDGLVDDRLGKLTLSREGLAARNARVFDAVDALGVPCVVCMGGGYAEPIEATVACFADLFVAAAARHAAR